MQLKGLALGLFVSAALAFSAHGVSAQVKHSDASYVFRGTVLKPLKGGAKGYVVRVDEVVDQKGQFTDQKGRQVFLLEPDREMKEGESFVFLTEPVMFGDVVTAKSIRIAAPEAFDPNSLGKERGSIAMQELQERLKNSPLVVQGTVVRVADFDKRGSKDTEHDPMLRNVSVKIQRLLKGKVDGEEARFLIATSDDVQWYRAPKLREGDTGIFLLRPAPDKLHSFGASPTMLTLIDPKDYLSTESLSTVEQLLLPRQ